MADFEKESKTVSQNDPEKFGDFLLSLQPYIRKVLRKRINAPDQLELVKDEIITNVIKRFRYYDKVRSFKPWLLSVISSTHIDHVRRNNRHYHANLDDVGAYLETDLRRDKLPTPPENAVMDERNEIVRSGINSLPPEHQALVEGHYIQGIKYKTLAEENDIPLGTVKSRLSTARLNLSAQFKEAGLDPNERESDERSDGNRGR